MSLSFTEFILVIFSFVHEILDTVVFTDPFFGGDVRVGVIVGFVLIFGLILHFLIPTP